MPVSDVTLVTEDTFGTSFRNWWDTADDAEKAGIVAQLKSAVALDLASNAGTYLQTWLMTANPLHVQQLKDKMILKLGMQT